MYPLAVEKGIPSDAFWGLTLEELNIQIEANQRINEREALLKANFDYRLAQMMAYAFNSPEKMPDFDKVYAFASQEPELTEEEKYALELERDKEIMMNTISMMKATQQRNNKE